MTIEAIENTPIYVKLPCKNELSPCKISFTYLSKGDLKIFMSEHCKMPNEEDCQRSVGKVKKMVIYAAEREKSFKNDFIYLSFLSYSGLAVEILVNYLEGDKDANSI